MPDHDGTPFVHRDPAPAARAALAAAVAGALLALALAAGAVWLAGAAALILAAALVRLWRARETGMTLTSTHWRIRGPGIARDVPLALLEAVEARAGPGGEEIRLRLSDGEVIVPPAACLPSADALAPELSRRRIPFRRR